MSASIIRALLQSLDGDKEHEWSIHDEVIEYLVSIIDDLIDEDADYDDPNTRAAITETLISSLAEFFPELESHDGLAAAAERTVSKLQKRKFMLSPKANYLVKGEESCPNDATTRIQEIVEASLPQTEPTATPQDAESTACQPCNLDDPRISSLVEIVPSTCRLNEHHVSFILFVVCKNDFERATAFILEKLIETQSEKSQETAAELRMQANRWAQKRKEDALRDRKKEETDKKAILDKYFMRADDSRVSHKPVVFVDESHKEKRTHFRFLDGQKVAFKNGKEKFVVESAPEWDGGSRGKVKTKRKGGVGWA